MIIKRPGGSGSGDVTAAGANTLTGQNTFLLLPNVPPSDMAAVTAANVSTPLKNTKYYDTISANRTYTNPTMNSGDGYQVAVDVTATVVLTFSSTVKRAGGNTTGFTTLALNTGKHVLTVRKENTDLILLDSVNNGRICFRTTFDPKAACDGTFDGIFLGKVGLDFPNGFKPVAWEFSCEGDPTTELDIDLMRADAYISQANSAVMDVLDTTAGVSSEATEANINGGAAVAYGKVMYLKFGTAYTEANHQCIFEMWGYAVN